MLAIFGVFRTTLVILGKDNALDRGEVCPFGDLLLFERFPKKHSLILFRQRDKVNVEGRDGALGYLLYYLSMTVN